MEAQIIYLVKDTTTGYKVLSGVVKADKFHVSDKSIVNMRNLTSSEKVSTDRLAAIRQAEMLNFYERY